MSSTINISCDTCDVVRQESVGVGMMGLGTELYACDTCQTFRTRRISLLTPPIREPALEEQRCGSCKHALRLLRFCDGPLCTHDQEPSCLPHHRCPCCPGILSAEFGGIVWD